MANLRAGVRVEICPARVGGKLGRSYAEYDGCSGPIVKLKGHGTELKATVDVKTDAAGRSGYMDVPVSLLRELG